jgi:hypothetical protein
MSSAKRQCLWLAWAVLAALAVTAPFNPVINAPAVLFPFYLVASIVGLLVIGVVIRGSSTGSRR